MKHTLAPALLVALVLTGCATAPAVRQDDAAIGAARALELVQDATRSSLAEAAGILSAKAGTAAAAADIAAAGRALHAALYPELPTPFTAGPVTGGDRASPFLARLLPILLTVHGGSSLDAATAQRMRDEVESVSYLAPDSVLPPWIEASLVLATKGRVTEARDLLEEALRRSPDFYPAARGIAGIIIGGGVAAKEIDRLVGLAALLPDPVEKDLALTRAYLAAGDWDKAADAAAHGLLAAPSDPRFALLRAEAVASSGDWYQALRILGSLRRLAPGDPKALLLEARLLSEKQGNGAEALEVLEGAGPDRAGDPDFLELRGAILLRMKSWDASADTLKMALAASPGRVTTLSLLLENAVEAGRWDEALSWVVQIPPVSRGPADLRNAWTAAMQRGDHGQAADFARALTEKSPGPDALVLEARALIAAGSGPDAARVIGTALDSSTDAAQRSELYLLRSRTGTTDASDDLRLSLLEDADNVGALAALADRLAAQGDYRKALEYARRASELAPDDVTASGRVHDIETRAAGN